jgi:hypothetical protein
MSFFRSLLGGKATIDASSPEFSELIARLDYEDAAELLDKAVEKEKDRILQGLSHANSRERQKCAIFIKDNVISALEGEPRPDRRQQSVSTMNRLVSELRPPITDEEFHSFNNAIFWYTHRLCFPNTGHFNPRDKNAQIISEYLSVPMRMIAPRLESSAARTGCRIFIMGMVVELCQSQKLAMNDFSYTYNFVLKAYDLLPPIPVEDYMDKVVELVRHNADMERVLRQGARSITMHLNPETHEQAPMDLLAEVQYAEMNESRFSQI